LERTDFEWLERTLRRNGGLWVAILYALKINIIAFDVHEGMFMSCARICLATMEKEQPCTGWLSASVQRPINLQEHIEQVLSIRGARPGMGAFFYDCGAD